MLLSIRKHWSLTWRYQMSIIGGLKIKNFYLPHAIFQGGMGAGVSRPELTRAVHESGGLGVLSSAGLQDIKSLENPRKHYTTYTAIREEIETAMAGGYRVGLNVMRVLEESYDETIRAAIDAKVSALFLGAGVPKKIERPGDTALILIVSSARALRIILHYWGQLPDAIVLEGPKAGGHLGFKLEEIDKPEFSLENLLPDVLKIAKEKGNIPVIVAGGIRIHEDIHKFQNLGASGIQMGTSFAMTHESRASSDYKQAVLNCTEEDIIVVKSSPCGFPFRILKGSPAYQELLAGTRKTTCQMGYVLGKDKEGKFTICKAHPNHPEHDKYFCICDSLRATVGLAPGVPAMYTVGSNAHYIKKLMSVAELMRELVYG